MTYDFDKVLSVMDKGRTGGNEGIPMGFNRLVDLVPNIQRGRYNIILGEPGSGKSAFMDTAYVLNPLDWYMRNKDNTDIKLKIFYYSFEIAKERLITKLITKKLFMDHNIIVDVNYILSFGRYRVSDEIYKLVLSYKEYFYRMQEHLTIFDNADGTHNPTGIRNDLTKWAEENGRITTENKQFTYIENNPNLHTLVLLDHLALTPPERGFSTKENIDKLSSYTITMRNKFNFSFTYLAQANRNINNIERLKFEGDDLGLKMTDIKDSNNPAQDADLVLGIINPSKFNIPNYRGYDITKLRGRQRFLNIAKNRDGEADGSLGMLFIGECGYFKELPKKEDMTDVIYDKISNLRCNYR